MNSSELGVKPGSRLTLLIPLLLISFFWGTTVSPAAPQSQTAPIPPVPPQPPMEATPPDSTPGLPSNPPPLAPRVKAIREARKASLKSTSSTTTASNNVVIAAPDSIDPRVFSPAFKQNLLRMGLDENQMRILAWKMRAGGRGVEPLNTAEREQRRDAIQARLQSILDQYEAKAAHDDLSAAEAQQQRRLQEIAKLFDKNKGKYRDSEKFKDREKDKERDKEKSIKRTPDPGASLSPDSRPGKDR